MDAVILAAGKGTRLSKITKEKPKCLIDIGKFTILQRQLEYLSNNGIQKIYIVVGYKAKLVKNSIKNSKNIHIIENKEYEYTDNIYSLYLAKDFIKDKEFILLNGDVVCDEEIIKRILKVRGKNVAPIDSKYYDLEELKVKIENGFIKEILPKNAPREVSNGSTIGIFKFSSEGSKLLFEEIEKCIKQKIKEKWFEFAINRILPKLKMIPLDIHGLKWVEIDTMEDVIRAKELFG